MDKINNINSIVNILRQRSAKRSAVDTKNKAAKTDNGQKLESKQAISQEQLIKAIQTRIAKTNKDTDGYREKVMAIIAESIVTWEFGENIINDPGFSSLVNNIIDSYKAEPVIAGKIDNIISKYN